MTLSEYENKNEVTVKELIRILSDLPPNAKVINGKERNIRIYPGRDTTSGEEVVMMC